MFFLSYLSDNFSCYPYFLICFGSSLFYRYIIVNSIIKQCLKLIPTWKCVLPFQFLLPINVQTILNSIHISFFQSGISCKFSATQVLKFNSANTRTWSLLPSLPTHGKLSTMLGSDEINKSRILFSLVWKFTCWHKKLSMIKFIKSELSRVVWRLFQSIFG